MFSQLPCQFTGQPEAQLSVCETAPASWLMQRRGGREKRQEFWHASGSRKGDQ